MGWFALFTLASDGGIQTHREAGADISAAVDNRLRRIVREHRRPHVWSEIVIAENVVVKLVVRLLRLALKLGRTHGFRVVPRREFTALLD